MWAEAACRLGGKDSKEDPKQLGRFTVSDVERESATLLCT